MVFVLEFVGFILADGMPSLGPLGSVERFRFSPKVQSLLRFRSRYATSARPARERPGPRGERASRAASWASDPSVAPCV